MQVPENSEVFSRLFLLVLVFDGRSWNRKVAEKVYNYPSGRCANASSKNDKRATFYQIDSSYQMRVLKKALLRCLII